jgi:DNA polymerase
MPDEIESCAPYLRKQLELIRPRALLAVGSFAAKLLTGDENGTLGRLRGEVHSYEGVPLVCTYHPAALLRNPKWTRSFWDDLQLLRNLLDSA